MKTTMTDTALERAAAPAARAESGGTPGAEAGPRVIRVALAGCGTVGGALVRLLEGRRAAIERAHGIRFELARVLVRDAGKARPAPFPPDVLTTDLDAFLAAPADLVVEAVGGLEPAGRIAASALLHGRTFVTANKALIAERGPALAAIARERGGRLCYEAAVAGGVPVIRTLRDALPETGVRRVRGILNGTTNYLLSNMALGVPFATALEDARALGYAEADPTRDLDGRDAADKVAILAWLAFGADPATLSVHRRGLLPEPDRIAADAAAFGGVAKLLGECALEEDGVVAAVEPVAVAPDSAAAHTLGPENFLEVETEHSGTIRLSGPGAGGGATASAVLSDMIRRPAREAPASPPPLAAEDGRAHAWILSVRSGGNGGSPERFLRYLREAGVAPAAVREDARGGIVRARTEPCPRARILGAERALERRGLHPVLTRCERRMAP